MKNVPDFGVVGITPRSGGQPMWASALDWVGDNWTLIVAGLILVIILLLQWRNIGTFLVKRFWRVFLFASVIVGTFLFVTLSGRYLADNVSDPILNTAERALAYLQNKKSDGETCNQDALKNGDCMLVKMVTIDEADKLLQVMASPAGYCIQKFGNSVNLINNGGAVVPAKMADYIGFENKPIFTPTVLADQALCDAALKEAFPLHKKQALNQY